LSYALDSNVLLRSIEADHPQQNEALAVISKLIAQGAEVFLIPQFFYEFWVVATRLKKENGMELSPAEAEAFLSKFESVFPIKYDNEAVFQEWRRLVTEHAVQGKPTHDARIAAALIVHDITNFVTFNKKHFKRFAAFNSLTPSEV
jgi:predicted nucleic acid-binding protein